MQDLEEEEEGRPEKRTNEVRAPSARQVSGLTRLALVMGYRVCPGSDFVPVSESQAFSRKS